MHGQAFNDVGKMRDEEVMVMERKETRQGKMVGGECHDYAGAQEGVCVLFLL